MLGVRRFVIQSETLAEAQIGVDMSGISDDYYSTVGLAPVRALEPYRSRLPESANDGT